MLNESKSAANDSSTLKKDAFQIDERHPIAR